MNKFEVTSKAKSPSDSHDRCFYCRKSIGDYHDDDCVFIIKKVKIRMTVEYHVEVPAHWHKESVEFHRNDSSWCANNAISELEELTKGDNCICAATSFEYLQDSSEPYLKEK